jgi:hypothetical protein
MMRLINFPNCKSLHQFCNETIFLRPYFLRHNQKRQAIETVRKKREERKRLEKENHVGVLEQEKHKPNLGTGSKSL